MVVPGVEAVVALESLSDSRRQDCEDRVGIDSAHDVNAGDGANGDLEATRHLVGMARIAQPQVISEQCGQLRAHESHLAGQLHRGLAQEGHVAREVRVEHDDRLGSHGAILRAAEGHGIDTDVSGDLTQGDTETRGRVGQPRAIEMQTQPARVHVVGEPAQLVDGVGRAEL